jgi:hypothetical protein
LVVAAAGVVTTAMGVVLERRMQRHRRPGVSYRDVTLRKGGGWRRSDLFTPDGLALQRRAAQFGWLGVGLWAAALVVWVAFQAAR